MSSTGIVMIVFIACVTGVVMHYISEKNKAAENEDKTLADDVLAQLDAIEERVRVLERIITENKFDLKREIERL
jgi:hypothetical protein